jgi:hypothetical protein
LILRCRWRAGARAAPPGLVVRGGVVLVPLRPGAAALCLWRMARLPAAELAGRHREVERHKT